MSFGELKVNGLRFEVHHLPESHPDLSVRACPRRRQVVCELLQAKDAPWQSAWDQLWASGKREAPRQPNAYLEWKHRRGVCEVLKPKTGRSPNQLRNTCSRLHRPNSWLGPVCVCDKTLLHASKEIPFVTESHRPREKPRILGRTQNSQLDLCGAAFGRQTRSGKNCILKAIRVCMDSADLRAWLIQVTQGDCLVGYLPHDMSELFAQNWLSTKLKCRLERTTTSLFVLSTKRRRRIAARAKTELPCHDNTNMHGTPTWINKNESVCP